MSNHFSDLVSITLRSGAGGKGSVSFRREKFIPQGGPDGGDGGNGGDVVLISSKEEKTLRNLRQNDILSACKGEHGKSLNRHGKKGEDLVIRVPLGTVIKDTQGHVIHQFLEHNEKKILLKGGRGGKGNTFFKSSVRQAPKFAQEGEAHSELSLIFELELIADFGFVGLPNAGKSTLLQKLTRANPKIGNYPFTTLIPNLGTLTNGVQEIVLADIPGLIEGASKGVGLGTAFLKHIKKTSGLVFVLDGCIEDIKKVKITHKTNEELIKVMVHHISTQYWILIHELQSFDTSLLQKHKIIVISRVDIAPLAYDQITNTQFRDRMLDALSESLSNSETVSPPPIHFVSSFTQRGIEDLKSTLFVVKSTFGSVH